MSVFDQLLSTVDQVNSMFDDADDSGLFTSKTIEYSLPAYPPCEMLKSKDGTVTINFAMAGFKKDDIEIVFDENKVIVKTVDKYVEPPIPENTTLLGAQRIKRKAFDHPFYVPEAKFNFAEIKAKFEDGILTVEIPPKEKREYKPVVIS